MGIFKENGRQKYSKEEGSGVKGEVGVTVRSTMVHTLASVIKFVTLISMLQLPTIRSFPLNYGAAHWLGASLSQFLV